MSKCSAIFIPTIKEPQSRLQQGRGQNRHPNHRSAEPDSTQKGWLQDSEPSVAVLGLLEVERGPKGLLKDLQRDHCREL